jgi:type IV secretory pathway TraG/TraD family ATPase VirD4
MIPTVLTQFGPVVVYSTKLDIARTTAMARARLGKVWCYDPTGAPPPWPGMEQLRWSPITEAGDWNEALEISRQMAAAADPEGQARGRQHSDGGHFFESRAADLLACVLHYAALTKRDMRFVVSRVSSQYLSAELHRGNRPNRRPDGPDLLGIVDELDKLGSTEAADKLDGIIWSDPKPRSDIFQTADDALRGYQGTALNSATDVNFWPGDFVFAQRQLPSEFHVLNAEDRMERIIGSYDTIYITVPAHKQSLYAPLVIGLLSAIQRATYALHKHDEEHGLTGGRQPVTFVLDEMYGAPLPDLPQLLADGGGQGLLICGALQDLSQAQARWGDVGKGFLTFWQNTLVLPGIRDDATLELLSKLTGEKYDFVETENWQEQQVHGSVGPWEKTWVRNIQTHVQRRRVITFDEISTGNPYDPSEVLLYRPNGGWEKLNLMKYWSGHPWPGMLLQSTHLVLNVYDYSPVTSERNPYWDLPLPNLMEGGDPSALYEAGGEQMVNWFLSLEREWESHQLEPESVGGYS